MKIALKNAEESSNKNKTSYTKILMNVNVAKMLWQDRYFLPTATGILGREYNIIYV